VSRSPRLEVPSSGFLESEIWEPRNLLGVGVVYCRWFVCAAVVCCGVHYAVRVSVRSNQQASESGETGEKGWLWGVGGGPAGVGIADGSEGRIDDKGEEAMGGRGQTATLARGTPAPAAVLDCVCAPLLCPPDPACFSRISALFSISCTFLGKLLRPDFLTLVTIQ